MSDRPPEAHTILDDAWGQVVGGMDWLQSVLFGEFSDHRTRSAMVADMLVSFVPGVVIVTSSRDAVAVILRLANHPEKREDLMEWVLLSACLIVIALPIAMAAGGLAAAGVGAVVGGIAGTELGAALRAVMLLLIKDAVELIRLMRFLQKFMTGNILLFLRSLKFAKYEKPVIEAVVKMTGKLVEIVKALRLHLESLRYFNSVKSTIIKLTEWERKFYAVQQDALKHMPRALAELDARLAKVLAQTAPKEAHAVSAGVEADKAAAAIPAVQRVRDTPGHVMARVEDEALATGAAPKASAKPKPEPKPAAKPKPAPKAKAKPKEPPKPPLKNKPDPVTPHTEGANTKKQTIATPSTAAHDAELMAQRVAENKALRESERYAADMAKVGVTDAQITKMWAKEAPLGFESPAQFNEFKSELHEAVNDAGLHDAEVGLKGTSTTFYSENPSKPLGHHWDADPLFPGDYDLNIDSSKMVEKLESAGVSPSEKYGVFKTRDINENFPALNEFQEKWTNTLGRDVNFVGYPSSPIRDQTEYILKEIK